MPSIHNTHQSRSARIGPAVLTGDRADIEALAAHADCVRIDVI
jgi:hypothetical protein